MIRIWLWEEAPAELKGHPGLEEDLKDKVPVWLAHVSSAHDHEEDLVRDWFVAGWLAGHGQKMYGRDMADGGVLMVGCLIDIRARTAEQ